MDHVPKTHSHPHRIEIPIRQLHISYGEKPLGFLGFRDFPSSQGYSLQDVLPYDVLQSWLFFGLLTEIFGGCDTQYKHEDFIKVDASGRRMTSTKMLDKYALYWMARRCHTTRAAVVLHTQSIDSCLRLANGVMNTMAKSLVTASAEDVWSSPSNTVMLSIMTLGEHLCSIRESVVKYSEAGSLGLTTLKWRMLLVEKTLEKEWCPGEISMLKRRCNLTCLYYLSTLGRTFIREKHLKCSEITGCQALQIDFATYKTAHTEDCACDERIGPVSDDVANIIQERLVPLVVGTSSTFNLMSSSLSGPLRKTYVAISHVWSDGLGNNDGNWLNECMFTRIQNLVNSLYEPSPWPVPFWMDTL